MSNKENKGYSVSRISYEDDSKAVVLQTALHIPEKNILMQAVSTGAGAVGAAAALVLFTSIPIVGVAGGAIVFLGAAGGAGAYEVSYNKEIREKTAQAREFLLEKVGCPVGWSFIFEILDYHGDKTIEVATPGSVGIVRCIAPSRVGKKREDNLVMKDMCAGQKFGAQQECIKKKILNKGGDVDSYKEICKMEMKADFEEWAADPASNLGRAIYKNFEMNCATGAIKEYSSEHTEL